MYQTEYPKRKWFCLKKWERNFKKLYRKLIESDVGWIPNEETDIQQSEVLFICSKGLLEYVPYTDGGFKISLSDAGRTYFEEKNQKRSDFLKRSIFVPIAVSLITNLIIAGAKWLWPLILQWLTHIPE